MFNPDQLVKALTIYSAQGRRENLVGGSEIHPLRNCLASGDTCSCASTLFDTSNTLPDLVYVFRNHLLEKVLSGTEGPGRNESRYHYHALDGSSLAKVATRGRAAAASRAYDANGRRINLDGMLKGSGADPLRLRKRMHVIESPERQR